MINAKKILGIVTTVAIVGVTIYTIKKYYDSKKQDQQSIGLDEAKQIVEDGILTTNNDGMENTVFGSRGQVHYDPKFKRHTDSIKYSLTDEEIERVTGVDEDDSSPIGTLIPSFRRRTADNHTLSNDQMEELVDEARDTASWNASFTGAVKPEDVKTGFEEEEDDEEDDVDPQEIQDSKGYFEEDKDVIDDLRYEPNSMEAREQFINMELANLGRDNDTRDVVAMLYDHPFVPTCDEDQNLKTRLIDHRIKFFGLVSRWTKEVTFGDVVMYYGKAAEYNCGNDVRYWVDYFLTCADVNNVMLTSDEFEERINALNKHAFYNEELESHGLFGLNVDQMTEAITIARKRIDEKVTYDIEFHQFIQGVVS